MSQGTCGALLRSRESFRNAFMAGDHHGASGTRITLVQGLKGADFSCQLQIECDVVHNRGLGFV